MDLTWLDDFLALAELRNFSRAADSRNVTQPAFSRRIRALEEWLGTPLFLRGAQGVSLTAAGEFLRPQAESMTRTLQETRQQALAVARREALTLSFAATHALSFTFFPQWIRLHVAFEELGRLNLISDSMEACEQIMLRGDANFLLCHSCRGAAIKLTPGHFTSIVVGKDVLLPVCAPDAAGAPLWPLPGSPDRPARYLAYSSASGLGRILAASWESGQQAMTLDRVFTSHLAAALLSMARQGGGVAWLPQTLAAADLAQGALVPAGPPAFSVALEIRLFRASSGQSPAADAFWRKLVASASEAITQ